MNQITTWDNTINAVMPQFERIARVDNHVRWQEESQFALQAIQNNSLLAKCNVPSIQNSIINVAAVGLTLNPADQYAYLVPEGGSCNLKISFKGLVKIATDSGSIAWVKAEIVKQNDQFEYKGPCEKPTHTMNPFSDRGATTGVYCIAKTKEGDYLVDVMSKLEIDTIKGCAKTKMVWDKWPDEMAKKAIIKRAAKQWPKTDKSGTLHKAIDVINDSEGSEDDEFANMEATASEILDLISKDDLVEAGRIWCECTEREQSILWTAKTKGGWFTMQEKDMIRKACAAFRETNI